MAVYQTDSPQETELLARHVGERLRDGDVVAYRGSMGAGKTAFTRGLAAGMGIGGDCVSSPTFAIVNEYNKNGRRLCHFDMYRIDGYDDLYSTGFFDYLDQGAVLVIEWSENIEGLDVLPKDAVMITISQTGENSRTIQIEGESGLKILAVDTSAVAASCAVCEDGVVLGESFLNRKLTHSQTILPMLEDMLKNCRLSLDEIDAFAVAAGPGSFTGLRIGISAVKALAFASGKPAAGVSTLAALAYNLLGTKGIICPAMDARCGQVYTAVFMGTETVLERLEADEAVPMEQLFSQLEEAYQREGFPIWFVGDGAELCYDRWKKEKPELPAFLAPAARRFAHASSAALATKKEGFGPAAELNPVYLRLPQAEREYRANHPKEKM